MHAWKENILNIYIYIYIYKQVNDGAFLRK